MGRATRWLRGLLGGKKSGVGELPAEHKEKRRWGFGKSFREKERPQLQQQQQKRGEPPSPAVSEERKGSYRERRLPYERVVMDEENQNKRAIAVAAATAVVAEAAVAAAQAAAVVVRLTSSGHTAAGIAAGKQEAAAIKIQSAFRGYLARRALRALRGLVKLQALVRGNIVRKQAAETLRCMQALVRVQARARASRAIGSETSASDKRPRTHAGLPPVDAYEQAVRANGTKSDNPCTLKRSSSKSTRMETVDSDRASTTAAWNWLDRWMEERYWDSREAVRKAGSFVSTDDEKNAKILEVDPGKPQHSGHKKHHQHQFSNLTPDHNSHSFTTAAESPSKHSSVQHSVPSPASVDIHQCLGSLMFPAEIMDYGESPQFFSASSRHGNSRKGPFTPSKSECTQSLFSGYSDYPNYMANTESSKAKVRSQSAPKQRPELEKTGSTKRSSAHGYGQPAAGALAHRSSSLHAKFANKAYPGSGRLDRLGMPLRI